MPKMSSDLQVWPPMLTRIDNTKGMQYTSAWMEALVQLGNAELQLKEENLTKAIEHIEDALDTVHVLLDMRLDPLEDRQYKLPLLSGGNVRDRLLKLTGKLKRSRDGEVRAYSGATEGVGVHGKRTGYSMGLPLSSEKQTSNGTDSKGEDR